MLPSGTLTESTQHVKQVSYCISIHQHIKTGCRNSMQRLLVLLRIKKKSPACTPICFKVMKFSHLPAAAILCCLGCIYCDPCRKKEPGYVYLLKSKEESATLTSLLSISYIIVGSSTPVEKSEVQNAGRDGKHYVQVGRVYDVEDCLGTIQAVMRAMVFCGWDKLSVGSTSSSSFQCDQPAKDAHSFEKKFRTNLKLILQPEIPSRGRPCTKESQYLSLLKSDEQKDGMWMYKIVASSSKLQQSEVDAAGGNGVNYLVRNGGSVNCEQRTDAAKIPLLSYQSTTDVDGLTVYYVPPLLKELFESVFAFFIQRWRRSGCERCLTTPTNTRRNVT